MRKAVVYCLVMALMACSAIISGPVLAAEYKVKIGGGPTGGTFNAFASGMAVYVPKKETSISATAVGSGGSVANVRRVHAKESDFGLSYGGDLWLGANGKLPKDATKYSDVRILGYLYGAPAQLVVRADSKIQSAFDLEGMRVAVGNAGSGAAASCERFFRHIKMWDGMKRQFLGYSKAAQNFLDHKIDAFWLLVGYPNRSVIEANARAQIRLINVGDDAEKSGFYKALPFYKPMAIPAGTYKDVGQCNSFQDATFLTANKDMPEDVVYRIMSLLWSQEGMKEMTTRKKTFSSMNLENNFKGASVPLHPGAVKFWEEKGVRVAADLRP